MRIAAIYPYDPLERSRIRSFRTLSVLAGTAPTTVFHPGTASEASGFPRPEGVTMRAMGDGQLARIWRFTRALATQRSLSFAFYRSCLRQALRSGPWDLVFVERLPIDTSRLGDTPIVFDTVDRFHSQVSSLYHDARGLRRIGYAHDMRTIAREQADYCNAATLVLCTTESEAQGLQMDGVTAPIQGFFHRSQTETNEFGNGRPGGGDLAGTRERLRAGRRKIASFHGRASYPANISAVRFTRETLAPVCPHATFLVFGDGWEESIAGNLFTLGRQRDLSLLSVADFGVFPLSTAVGIPNKVIECLAYGLPVVVSPALEAILPRALKAHCRDRIHVARLEDFAARIHALDAALVRSDDAGKRFRRFYDDMIARSENDLAVGIRGLAGASSRRTSNGSHALASETALAGGLNTAALARKDVR
jgi:hypothetical protein